MTTFEVYWLTRCNSIHDAAFIVAFILGMAAILVGFMYPLIEDVTEAKPGPLLKKLVLSCFASILVITFVPTTKELVAIYGISYLTQNKDAREIPAAALKVLNKELQELAKEE